MNATDLALIPTREEMSIYESIAKYATDSKHFEKLGGVPGVMCIALRAREMGISPFEAIYGGFSNVQGKMTMSAELMGCLIRRNGHGLKIEESTDTVCRITGTRKDTGESYTASFTLEDAKKALLIKEGSAWTKYPSDMLYARCLSRLRRRLFQDVATKAYVEGEIDEEEDFDKKRPKKKDQSKDVIDVTPQSEEAAKEEKPVVPEPTITIAQAIELENLLRGDAELLQKILEGYQINALIQIKEKHFKYIKDRITSLKQNLGASREIA